MVVNMAEVTLIDALTMAMAWELEHDPDVVILGESTVAYFVRPPDCKSDLAMTASRTHRWPRA